MKTTTLVLVAVTCLGLGVVGGTARAESQTDSEGRMTRRVSGDIPMKKEDSGMMDRELHRYSRPHDYHADKSAPAAPKVASGRKHTKR